MASASNLQTKVVPLVSDKLAKRPHEYLGPLREQYAYCKRCARRMTVCLRCGYCYLCHPFKEADEEAEILHQSKISQFIPG